MRPGGHRGGAVVSAAYVSALRHRIGRAMDWTRFHVGLRLAYVCWSAAEALTAVGNWLEDLATAKHPLAFKTHWKQRGESINWWQR